MKRRLIILLLIAAALSAVSFNLLIRVDFIPRPSSAERESIDHLVKILFSIASIFFSLIAVFFVDSVIFFRRKSGDMSDGPAIRGHGNLERAWTLVPLAIVIGLSVYGAIILNQISRPAPPQSTLEVGVLAFRFGWQFTYPEYGNLKSFELELPVDRRVHFLIQSKDVVHSFWVPELGPKQDAVPGMTTELWITPVKIGQYQVMCSQLCGFGHTYMIAPAKVVSATDFQAWVKQQQAQQSSTK